MLQKLVMIWGNNRIFVDIYLNNKTNNNKNYARKNFTGKSE